MCYLPGENDVDFFKQAQEATSEIPGACFIAEPGVDNFSAHAEVARVLSGMLEMLRLAHLG